MGVRGGSVGKESTCNVGDVGRIPGLGRSSGEGHGYPLQYSSLENSLGREAWRAMVHGVTKSQTGLRTNTFTDVKCHLLADVWASINTAVLLWKLPLFQVEEGSFPECSIIPF